MIFDFFKSTSKMVPEKVQKEVLGHFPNAINIEWHKLPTHFESIFYLEEVEHIADISLDGHLLSYKKNLKTGDLPAVVREKSELEGEIMSAISHHTSEGIQHEIIIRKKDFSRYLLAFNVHNVLTEIKSV